MNYKIQELFNFIAPKYNVLNHLLSFNLDMHWRNVLVKSLPNKGKLMDLCSGTGDIAIKTKSIKKDLDITATDFSVEMIQIAKKTSIKKTLRINYLISDCHQIPIKNNTFDYSTIAFGLRNCSNINIVLNEIYRTLKKNGLFYILEFAPSNNILYKLYLRYYMPLIAKIIIKTDKPHLHLNDSIQSFMDPSTLTNIAEETGFKLISLKKLSFGICYIYQFYKL